MNTFFSPLPLFQVSFDLAEYTANVDGVGTLRLLDAIKTCNMTDSVRFYQASTSELYGKVQEIPQKETTIFYPRSPYGNNYIRTDAVAKRKNASFNSSPILKVQFFFFFFGLCALSSSELKLSTQPEAKCLIEGWSGSRVNKESFITILKHRHMQALRVCERSGFLPSVV